MLIPEERLMSRNFESSYVEIYLTENMKDSCSSVLEYFEASCFPKL